MISNKNNSYDYDFGFSRFPDGFKFKYNDDGEICFSTDCSTWAKRVLNNLPLPEFLESEAFNPPSEILSFPDFGTIEKKKKWKKEKVGNYIEDCEFCGSFMEKTFRFCGKLVCEPCNQFLKYEKCFLLSCGNMNRFCKIFIEDCEKTNIPFNLRFIRDNDSTFCQYCYEENVRSRDLYFRYNTGQNWIEHNEYDQDWEQVVQNMYNQYTDEDYQAEACRICESENGGSICRDCRLNGFW
jgi:hypothetical protein